MVPLAAKYRSWLFLIASYILTNNGYSRKAKENLDFYSLAKGHAQCIEYASQISVEEQCDQIDSNQ